MFKRIDHVEMVTRDPERAMRFYTGVLEFRLRERDRIPGTPVGPVELTYLELGGTTLELIHYAQASPDAAPEMEHYGYRMMALEVEDMTKALEYLKGKGVECVWGPKTTPTYARAEIVDPDGNRIELRQWY